MKQYSTSFNTTGLKLPVITLSTAALSLLMYFWRSYAGPLFQYDRNLIANGEFWRIVTSHFTHWSFDHFLWCTITFIALGAICEQCNRRGFVLAIAVSAICIPVVSWFADPGMMFYRGLSGICSSIFIVGVVLMIKKALADKDWVNVLLPAVGGILFIAKTVIEFIGGQAVFVHADNIFSPVPLAHLVGGIIGFVTVFFIPLRIQR